ncbi:hypothetical protein Riv7116_6267 [Rivularia sp. PCC 7116]|uniref:MBL fold metallo-hydrolase n=1 Tax=Rivularia sp. PCC 7116 TaxID=373994 RepID=UPI00029F06BF|nr:MBL fold metallo-hydrolase [Rivularia sp. PCC 7116]AFY58616.1 hypothetical protein Riv7116_6267 [Rivularia sp. PCC 7116]
MNNAISFSQGSQIRPFNVNDRVCLAIQPFIQEVLNRFVECQNLGESIKASVENHQEIVEQAFEIDNHKIEESFTLKQEFLFPEENPLLFISYDNPSFLPFLNKKGVQSIKDESILPDIHQLLYSIGQSKFTYQQIKQQISEPMVDLLDKLIKSSVVKEKPAVDIGVPLNTPGVFRLQHASVLYRTKTTGILVDPHLHSNYGIPGLKSDINRAQLEGLVDGILISHPHYDHWHYPTLMMFAKETPIFVPKVPRASIMCEDMAGRLKSLGFTNVIAVDWYSEPIRIGDININVLPFYGEQALVPEFDKPKYPELRNWGNTYLIDTEFYKSWLLIDAGQEPNGSMIEVAEYVKNSFGSIDLLISNFQPLSYNSIGTNLSGWGIDIVANLLSNPQIFSVTNKPEGAYIALLGPKGVAEVCNIVNASYCFPYADSWAEAGKSGMHDEELIPQVQAELQKIGCSTKVIPWKIGDGYVTRNVTEWNLEAGNWYMNN